MEPTNGIGVMRAVTATLIDGLMDIEMVDSARGDQRRLNERESMLLDTPIEAARHADCNHTEVFRCAVRTIDCTEQCRPTQTTLDSLSATVIPTAIQRLVIVAGDIFDTRTRLIDRIRTPSLGSR